MIASDQKTQANFVPDLDSLQALPARSWSFVDIGNLVSLISLSRKAFNPYRSDSEKVDVTFLLSYQ